VLRCRWLLTLLACRGAHALIFADGRVYFTSAAHVPGYEYGDGGYLKEFSGSYRVSSQPSSYNMRILLSSPGMVPAACAACLNPGFTAGAEGSSSCTMTFSLPLLALNCIQIIALCFWYFCICGNVDEKTEQCGRCSERCDREKDVKARTAVYVVHAATTIVGFLLSAVVVSRALEHSRQPSAADVDLAALLVSLVAFVGSVAIVIATDPTLPFRKQFGGGHVCCSCLMKDASTSKVMDVE